MLAAMCMYMTSAYSFLDYPANHNPNKVKAMLKFGPVVRLLYVADRASNCNLPNPVKSITMRQWENRDAFAVTGENVVEETIAQPVPQVQATPAPAPSPLSESGTLKSAKPTTLTVKKQTAVTTTYGQQSRSNLPPAAAPLSQAPPATATPAAKSKTTFKRAAPATQIAQPATLAQSGRPKRQTRDPLASDFVS